MRLFVPLCVVFVAAPMLAEAQAPVADGGAYALAVPPAGFKPDMASAEALAAYGLPSRPSPNGRNRVAYDAWMRAMRAARHYVAPVLVLRSRQHGLPIDLGRGEATDYANPYATAYTSQNWAGQGLVNGSTSYGSASFSEIMAQWVISGVQQAVGTCGGTDYSATWVGVDGLSGSADVMQAGTEADAYCNAGYKGQQDYAWFEWYPANEYQISNFPIVVGGSVFVVVQASSNHSGTATFVNLQTGAYTVAGLTAPSGTTLRGDSAEWIVERPAVGGAQTLGTLADFGEIPMESEIGYLLSEINTPYFNTPGAPTAGQSGQTLSMVNSSGTTIATTVPQGGAAQLIQVSGPTE
jgi:hypothetical protein